MAIGIELAGIRICRDDLRGPELIVVAHDHDASIGCTKVQSTSCEEELEEIIRSSVGHQHGVGGDVAGPPALVELGIAILRIP